ncbi:hypothetical protein GJ699_29620 [Duganella sp. FT80W]|uniref:Enoyl-CoA hydratase/isomerase family protein n=1 Tax=Duganella guangzhouensis TaxID=2666084 RepID=A0A6I2L7H9_9BURK|nr:enoyl-CoA hydratase/isomerase family protein [Duganella guangzhouensis]MRW94141.1 hypothetical protein [Duganella guangzhouensis]
MISTHQNGDTLTVLLTARAINPLSRLFQRELAALLEQLEARRARLAAVVIGFNTDNNALNHELEHLMALTPAQAADCMHMLGAYNALLRRLETLGLPVIAALSGDVSGHALGLALACHHRLALRGTRLSMPQVRLGLTPVCGAIARSVRLLGLPAALPLLLEGAVLTVGQAQQMGLLHAVASDETRMARLISAVLNKPVWNQPWESADYRPPGDGSQAAALRTLLQTAPALLRERHGNAAPAAEAILCAMVEGLQVDFKNALLIESRYFCQTALRASFSTDLKRFL